MPRLLLLLAIVLSTGVGAQRPSVAELTRAGVASANAGKLQEARQQLASALQRDPAFTPASMLLGEVLYRMGELDAAILVYDQALAHAPNHEQILKRLGEWRKESELHARFGQRLSNHFTVMFEGPAEAALAERAVALLEHAYQRIGGALYTYPAEVITVVLYTREQFRDITQSPEWSGGVFDGRIRVPVRGALQNMREFERILSHEFTHALVRSVAPRGVPTWLNEGLAVVFEGGDLSRKQAQVRQAPAILPFTQLEGSFRGLASKDASLAYAQSAVAANALLEQAGASAVMNLLTDVGAGTPFAAAFERHILMSYEEFQRKVYGGQAADGRGD